MNLTKLISTHSVQQSYLLSVIIPTYNRQDELIYAIQSLDHIHNKEKVLLIIIDNCSLRFDKDLIINVLVELKIDYFLYRNLSNLGSVYSFNVSVELAKSKYIMYLFDDDRLTKNINKLLIKLLEHDKCDNQSAIYFFNKFRLDGSLNWSLKARISSFIRNMLNILALRRLELGYRSLLLTVPSFIGAVYSRDKIMELGGFNPECGPTSDYDFTIRYWEKYGIIRYKNQVIEYHHGKNDSMNPETKRLFPIDNYRYRTELMNRLQLTNRENRIIHSLIKPIDENSTKVIRFLNHSSRVILNIFNYLNVI
jgi:GT2 family glycosyltransferase